MTVSSELFMAILSMDAYNRGYNAGIGGPDGLGSLNGTTIGDASIAAASDSSENSAERVAGFYAVAYEWQGQTVISYRGTDSLFQLANLNPWSDAPGGDIWNSYAMGAGSSLTAAAHLAADFFQAVTGTSDSDPSTGSAILTGHSMGGGLAGFIASIYHQQGYLYDNMAFEGAALDAYNRATAVIPGPLDIIASLIWTDFYNNQTPLTPEIGANLHAFATTGEFLHANRLLQSTHVEDIDSNGGLRDPVNQLHSISLLSTLLFAKDGGYINWTSIGSDFIDSLFDENVGLAAGFDPQNTNGTNSAAGKMLSAIAYSALDGGLLDDGYGYVFGNTGIRALFDDADELGVVMSSGKASEALEDSVSGLTQAIVQFAGLMANRKVNYHEYELVGYGTFHPEDGILQLSDNAGNNTESATDAALVTLSVNQDLWKLGLTDPNALDIEILGLGTLVEDLFHQAGGGISTDTIREAMKVLYGAGNAEFSVTKTIGSVQFSLSEGPLDQTLSDPGTAFDATHTSLFAATDEADTINGNTQNNIIAGADGNDTLYGRLGGDLLLGGDGSDTFIDSVTEKSNVDDRQNENDIYIGSSEYTGVTANFLQWLANGTETDIVRYTVDDFGEDDPNTAIDESPLQHEGVRITDLETRKLGEADAVKITVEDMATAISGTDILLGIERVELSDRADTFNVNEAALDTAILVDMGKSGRVQSELPEGETASSNAFTVSVDTADYSQVDHGLIYIKGVTQEHTTDVSFDKVFTTDGLGEEVSAIIDYSVGGILGYNDALHVKGADKVVLTDQDDVLISADYGSIVYTGEGNDKVWFQDGVAIADLSEDDRISLLGVFTLYGGLKNGWSESPWAWGPYGTAYGLNAQGELIISNVFWQVTSLDENGTPETHSATTYVLNFADTLEDVEGGGQLGAGHIFLLEYKLQTVLFRDMTQDQIGKASAIGAGAFDLIGWMIKTMTGTAWFGGEDPLVLDLDGDGLELTPLDHAKSRYDIDGDLYAEATGFVGGDDGILARDINGNGQIDSSSEMFGQGQTSGFEFLKALDGNLDGVVDAGDNTLADFNGDGVIDGSDTFDKLLVWQDADEDLHTDFGELKSVSEWSITSFAIPSEIVAPGTAENPDVINGNIVNQTGIYTTSDGLTHTVGDVTLRVENQTTTYVGAEIEISQDVLDLPDLKGYGTLVSLHEAMSLRPGSEAEVRDAITVLTTPDLATLRVLVQPVLEAWALGSPIKIDGVVQTNVISQVDYDDMIFIRNGDDVVDYTTSISEVDSAGNVHLSFASGAGLDVTLAEYSSEMTSDQVQGALRSLLNMLFSADSEAAVFVTSQLPNGAIVGFETDAGSVLLSGYDTTTWIYTLALGQSHSLAAGSNFAGISANEFAFYERVMGESLEPFFEEPDDAAAGNDALKALIAKMDTVLNTFAVRIAVQSGPLSDYFDTIDYDVINNGFISSGENRISDVFHALLVDAETDASPVNWLSAWKPFMDVFFADYSRGESNLPVSYGYLVQQMMNAVERAAGGITVQDYAEAFGIPEDLVSGGIGTVTGRGIEDIILIDGDEALVQGGSGADNYIVGKDFSAFELYDLDAPLAHDFDTIRFSNHNVDEIVASRDGLDLLLTDVSTGEAIRITNEFEGRMPGPTIGDASFDYGIDQIVFGDGTVWSKTEIALAVSRIDNNSTTVVGTADIDVLQGGHGDDRLEGGGDTDIYRYSFGDGADTINDLEDNALRNDNDMLQFLNGIRIGDLIFEREDDSNDLTIMLKDHPGDMIIIEGIFGATYTGVFGNWYQNRIELFTFDDGSSLSFTQLASLVLNTYSSAGNDHLYGMNREDILVARQGNDYVSGGNESDTYVFNLGDGQDIYQDRVTNILSGIDDMLVFGAGISSEDIVFSRVPGDTNTLVLTIAGTDDSVTLLNEYASIYASVYGVLFFDQIETVHFRDEPGTVWTAADMAQLALDAEKTAGSDTIYGFDVDDVLDGGAGNDFLFGGNGNDTYIWGAGYGNDVVQEGGEDIMIGGDTDTVVFQGGLNSGDVAVSRNTDASDLVITITSTGETLTLHSQVGYTSINYHPDMVDRLQFADETIWNEADLRERYLSDAITSGNDTIIGFYSNDTLSGGAGTDLLQGGDGSDIYLFGYGSGHDIVEEVWNNVLYSDDDKVVFGTGITRSDVTFARAGNTSDLLITLTSTGETLKVIGEFYTGNFDMNDIEEFKFSDGTTVTEDELRGLLLSSTSASETIYGFDKSDVFHYGAGGGNDVFIDAVNSGSQDRLVLDDLLQSDVTFSRDINDLIITVSPAKGGGIIRLTNSLNDYVDQGIEFVQFSDGSTLTRPDMRGLAVSGSATNGNDTINGTNAADVLQGGLGNDFISGFASNDTYIYASGDGNDVISDYGIYLGTQDRLVLNGILPSEISVQASGDDLVLAIAESHVGAGDAGQITLVGNGSSTYDSGIESVVFDDGTIWTAFDIRARYFASVSTDGADTIVGFNTPDTLEGGLGNDVISGGAGSDTYIYSRDDGNDAVNDYGTYLGTADKLVLHDILSSDVTVEGTGDNLVLAIAESGAGAADGGRITLIGNGSSTYNSGVESVVFDDGTIWSQSDLRALYFAGVSTDAADTIVGFNTSDTIQGGLGNDFISGGAGDDTYIYVRGDGNDIVSDYGIYLGTQDKLVLHDIAASQVIVQRSGDDFVLVVGESNPGDGGRITLVGNVSSTYNSGVEFVVFDSGTVWNQSDLRSRHLADAGTSNADTIVGYNTDDTIIGGQGNDVLDGAAGSDTYIYLRGDGTDTISDAAGSADRLVFSDIASSGVSFSKTSSNLMISISPTSASAGDGGTITVTGIPSSGSEQGLESIGFSDGITLSKADIIAALAIISGTSGNDTIVGSSAADTIAGRGGDDVIDAGASGGGDDTYQYARGDGNDTITEAAGSYNDQLKFTNLNVSNVNLVRDGIDLKIVVSESSAGAGDGGSILVKQTLDDYYGRGIEKVVFADGSQWTLSQMRQMVLDQAGTSGNDTIVGFNTNDTIAGRAGNDAINAGYGDDIYLYSRGNGNDTIDETSGGGGYGDKLSFTNINASDVSLVRVGNDLNIAMVESSAGAGDGGSVLIKQTLDSFYDRGIETVEFSGGVQWTIKQMRQMLLTQAATSGNDTILGFNTNDTIAGGAGNDALNAATGDDVYLYSRSDGNDTIDETNGGGGYNDKLSLTNIASSEVALVRNGNDVNIVIGESGSGAGDGGSILIKQTLDQYYDRGIETIAFSGGIQWTIAQIRQTLLTQATTNGNDTILGFNTNDTIVGGGGNDTLNAATGDDVYLYSRGDGNDTINETSGGGGYNDRLSLTDISSSQVELVRNGNDLSVVISESSGGAGDGGLIVIKQTLENYYDQGIENLAFAGGVVWNRAQMIAHIAYVGGTAGNETITGSSGDDIILSGLGNDTLVGLSGNDIFVFESGFGQDVINDFVAGSGAVDAIRINDGFFANYAAVIAAASQAGNDTLITYNENNTIRLKNIAVGSLHQDDFVFG